MLNLTPFILNPNPQILTPEIATLASETPKLHP